MDQRKIILDLVIFYFVLGSVLGDGYRRRSNSHSHERSQNAPRRDVYPFANNYKPPRWYGEPPSTASRNTCPCVKRKDTGECVGYDSRFQAATLEEAVLHFPDLQIGSALKQSSENPSNASATSAAGAFGPTSPNENISISALARSRVSSPNQSPSVPLPGDVNPASLPQAPSLPTPSGLCGNDRQCLACSTALMNRLSDSGIAEKNEWDQATQRLGIPQLPQRSNCDKYRFGRRSQASFQRTANYPLNSTPPVDPALDSLIKQLQQKGEENWRKKQATRIKRQSSSKPGTTLGQQFKIDCSKRGEPVEQGSSWVGLCNVCWAWRKLPSSYFPQYVNELICDKDTRCMSGWGGCQQRYKSVDILQNTGTDANPVWKQVTISVANYCDCEVESGSSMHNFVAA